MNDRELLELAAKAAGTDLRWHDGWNGMPDLASIDGFVWNPLTDDGDALRLAVKLRLDVMTCGRHAKQDEIQVGGAVVATTFQPIAHPYDDPLTATRRAIVRAAAEIGKEMK